MNNTLLACPFCGGKASAEGTIKYAKTHDAWWADGTRIIEAHFVNCMTCGISNKGLCGHQTPALAISRWNTRSQYPSLDLLTALQRLLRANEGDYQICPAMDVATAFETNSQAIIQARTAIAKAMGQNAELSHRP